MRILVTGGAGFIGSHLAAAYLRDGHEVAVLDNFRTGSKRNLPAAATLFVGDIAHAPDVERACREFQPEAVNHHAAQLDVRASLDDPAYDAGVNILGGLNVLLHAVRTGARRFIFASSGGAIYGDAAHLPADERTAARPMSPYGLTKQTFESYLHIWREVHGVTPVILRYSNVYGPRQNAHGDAGVIAIFSQRLLRGRPCTIFGDGQSTRDYVYVEDVVEANRLALTKGDGGVFNVGTGRETTIREVYDTVHGAVAELLGTEAVCAVEPEHIAARPGEVHRSVLDAGLARETLGWKPRMSFREGVARTVEYLRAEA